MTKEELETQVKKFAISYWRKRNRIGDNFSVLDLIHFTTDFVTEIAIEQETKKLEAQIKKMKCCGNCTKGNCVNIGQKGKACAYWTSNELRR